MNDPTLRAPLVYKALHKVRFVTAASLFDGHDASINIMRRILQSTGCEVIHLGHNRSVEEIVDCAIQEDAHGIAVSSYQGGHVEYFKYMIDLLRERGATHIKVFGGGGGVIVPSEIEELHDYGVARIFSPEDGHRLGLQGMINEIVAACDVDLTQTHPQSLAALREGDRFARTRALCSREPVKRKSRHSASPEPVARARARSPTSSCAAFGSTTAMRCASRSSPSTPPGANRAARCSATASA